MDKLAPSMRLKVKGDTFFLPDSDGGVYFRNNIGSFRMEGNGIDQWIEKLIPVFNGEHTLEDLTDGLPTPYQKRIYEIAELLYRNGFVQDVSTDQPHQLSAVIAKKYDSQIQFINSFTDSGAYRFQKYREANVLTIGSGHFLLSLIAALLESGLPKVSVIDTKMPQMNQERLQEFVTHARKTDPDVAVNVLEITPMWGDATFWRKIVNPFDVILYGSATSNLEQLQVLETACKQEKKLFVPALCMQQVGIVGPIVQPDSDCSFESGWRRVHLPAVCKDSKQHAFSSTAGAILANLAVFEIFKTITGVNNEGRENSCFLLNLETLEGNWHSFLPFQKETLFTKVEWKDVWKGEWKDDVKQLSDRTDISTSSSNSNSLLPYFDRLTSEVTGIFHSWEEGELTQLPLAQCRMQAVDPLSKGPAELLPSIHTSGITHEEARREAGLAGIEAYVARIVHQIDSDQSNQSNQPNQPNSKIPLHREGSNGARLSNESIYFSNECIGVGAGQTVVEGICRGLQTCLFEVFQKQSRTEPPTISNVQLSKVEDPRCQFYLQAVCTIFEELTICLGQSILGFPVVFVCAGGRWYGCIDLHLTLAMRRVLQHVLVTQQNKTDVETKGIIQVSTVCFEPGETKALEISSCEETDQSEILAAAIHNLHQYGIRLSIADLAVESFLREELAGVFGVRLRKEESK